jgi:hypothetical protein
MSTDDTQTPVVPNKLHLESGLDSAGTGTLWRLANVAPTATNDLDPFTSIVVSILSYIHVIYTIYTSYRCTYTTKSMENIMSLAPLEWYRVPSRV